MRMCVYEYAYMCISIRVYAYWSDVNYAYILVRIYLSCTADDLQRSMNRTAHVELWGTKALQTLEGHPVGHILSKEKSLAALV